jgi:hypothetical protein
VHSTGTAVREEPMPVEYLGAETPGA